MIFTIPIKIVSEANLLRQHWSKANGRRKIQDELIGWSLKPHLKEVSFPCKVKLTRIAPKELDYANLVYAMKHPEDVVCDLLIPGLQPGRADGVKMPDGTKKIQVEYFQRRGKVREYALEIEINDA